jgi:phosphoglycolate phosphatase
LSVEASIGKIASMRTLLFDIDGTLLLTNGGGSGALKLAMEREFLIDSARTDIRFSGRTDRSLLAELLERNNLPTSDEHQQRLRDCYTKLFPDVLARRGGRVLPGAVELLNRLSSRSGLRCYVMTGNLHETGRRKLDHFGLLPFFERVFGGDHDHERNRLAERTVESIRRLDGESATRDLVVIGDTPEDIRCGHAIGAQVVAVCTGHYDRDDLEAENPTSVHDDLSDVETIFDLLVG